MLAHRLRRWPNIKPTLVQRLVFAGVQSDRYVSLISMWSNVKPHTHTTVFTSISQHSTTETSDKLSVTFPSWTRFKQACRFTGAVYTAQTPSHHSVSTARFFSKNCCFNSHIILLSSRLFYNNGCFDFYFMFYAWFSRCLSFSTTRQVINDIKTTFNLLIPVIPAKTFV